MRRTILIALAAIALAFGVTYTCLYYCALIIQAIFYQQPPLHQVITWVK
jgi:hypothetical protein